MERKIVEETNISEVVFEEDLYPRSSYNWQTSYDYSQSMLTGAQFPFITLAVYKGKKYLVDGKHRIEALRMLKQTKVEAEIFVGWNKKKIFEEAVKRNIAHGRILSPYEKRRIALKLRDVGYGDEEVSDLIQVPLDKLEKFVAQRLTNSLTGEVIVKSEIKHLAGQDYDGDITNNQEHMKSKSQVVLFGQVVHLFENDLVDRKHPVISKLLNKLKKLL